PAYAPSGKQLIAASVTGYIGLSDDELNQQIKNEMKKWFGASVNSWQHLKTYRIRYALPDQRSVRNTIDPAEMKLNDHLYVAGDHLLNGSINAAMKSGRLVAELI
ncbi:MAG: FAD-dependent oxidoreductase, partial [Bacteroidota bacterium]